MLLIAYIQLSPFRQIIDTNSTFIVFFIAWPLVELICIRGFLANRLTLIDAFIIFAFDVTPAVIMAKFENVKFDDVGPILSFTKMGGYAIEGYLVIRALKRKNEIEPDNKKSLSLVQVKPSHGT
ncbi:hypothetical protein CAEBREN_20728 [Caenorhabditis brenneri]|uniref:Uncharacterized protein n=1 Tax=Caenorhabditis brenneri TaxID=135651 RepID=G0NEG6_CAEBE|nr:hypothetical protein CAEBREN_20728 [Caenorhabditis brenneri]